MNIKIAKRENNSKREFVFVNTDQSKHIPSNPISTYIDCLKLKKKLREIVDGRNKRVLVIAFAETATGIGIEISDAFDGMFVTTTREKLPICSETRGKIFDCVNIEESHSHAPEQKLYITPNLRIEDTETVVIIDDEYTTGNTALKLIAELKKRVKADCQFVACSFLMSKDAKENFALNEVRSVYLVETESDAQLMAAIKGIHNYPKEYKQDKTIIEPTNRVKIYTDSTNVSFFDTNRQNLGCYSKTYKGAVTKTINNISHLFNLAVQKEGIGNTVKKINIIGTEEYNFIPYLMGLRLYKEGYDVKVQSITRSPILVSDEESYPLHSRVKLRSFYDINRVVYLYNMDEEVDVTLIITDTQNSYSDVCAIMQDIGGVVNSKLTLGFIVK